MLSSEGQGCEQATTIYKHVSNIANLIERHCLYKIIV